MALADILEALRGEAQAEIASIERARDTELAAITRKQEQYVIDREAQAKSDRERRAHKVYERIISKARHQAAFIETRKQQEKIRAVMDEISHQLNEMDAASYTNYLTQNMDALSAYDYTEAQFVVAFERADETTAFLTSQGVAPSQITTEAGLGGGFKLVLPTREIDMSFTALVAQIRSEELPRINRMLLS